MKTQSSLKRCVILAAAAGVAFFSPLGAQAAESFVNGTLQSFEPKTFVVKSETRPAPTTYTAAANIEFVDDAGVAIAPELIKPGMRVSVYYFQQEAAMVAHRVIVRGEVAATTTVPDRPVTTQEAKELRDAQELSEREARRAAEKGKPVPSPEPSRAAVVRTTTSEGTITGGSVTEFVPSKTLVVKARTGPAPVPYLVTEETRYVDEAGAPVTVERLSQGRPVTVYYVRDGDRTIASRVVVHSEPRLTKARAKALREYYQDLAKGAETKREKAEAKALAEYYDELKDGIED